MNQMFCVCVSDSCAGVLCSSSIRCVALVCMERIPATAAAIWAWRHCWHPVAINGRSKCVIHWVCISYVSYAYVLIRSGWLSVCVLHKRALCLQVLCVLACGSSFPLAFCQYTFSPVCFLLGQQGMTQHAVLKSLLVCERIPSEALESPVCPHKSHDVSDISYEPYPSLYNASRWMFFSES